MALIGVKGNKLLKIFYSIIFVFGVLFSIYSFLFWDIFGVFYGLFIAFIPVFGIILLLFYIPKLNKRLLGTVSEYVFSDNEISVISINSFSRNESKATYELVIKVLETREYVYLYINKVQVQIVDKNGFSEGSADDLRELLKSKVPPKKYKKMY